jgi:hypothetical protein
MEGSVRGLFLGIILVYFWRDLGKPRKSESEYGNPCLDRNPRPRKCEVEATNHTSSQVCKFYYICNKRNRVWGYC